MSEAFRNKLWIGNEWHDAASGETFAGLNPATGEVLADVAAAAVPARASFPRPAAAPAGSLRTASRGIRGR